MNQQDQYYKELLVSLRKITQAIDLHSKDLKRKFGLTVPQLVILQEVSLYQQISVSELARSVSLSQATVTDIVNRLTANGYLNKERSDLDKRRVMITPLDKCHAILEKAPPPLQEVFINKFSNLEHWEQLMLLSALDRIVSLMAAEKIDAAPILATGPIDQPAEQDKP
jgi:DNA-binding MarR family transcriptional regulator